MVVIVFGVGVVVALFVFVGVGVVAVGVIALVFFVCDAMWRFVCSMMVCWFNDGLFNNQLLLAVVLYNH